MSMQKNEVEVEESGEVEGGEEVKRFCRNSAILRENIPGSPAAADPDDDAAEFTPKIQQP